MLRIICERRHEHFTQKSDDHLFKNNHKIRSRVNNKLVLPPFKVLVSKRHCILRYKAIGYDSERYQIFY